MSESQKPGVAALIVLGVVALLGAVAAYTQENSSGGIRDGQNYTLALLLLGAGAFALLIAAILSSNRPR